MGDPTRALEQIEQHAPACLLVDYGFKLTDGSSLCCALRGRAEWSDLPILVVCGNGSGASRAIDEGASDIIRKPVNWRIASQRLDGMARLHLSLLELGRTKHRLAKAEKSLAETEERLVVGRDIDHLTYLPNRSRFETLVERALATSKADSRHAVLYLDIDRFRAINEIVGRAEGDQILRRVASRLRSCLQSSDLLTRRSPGVGTAAVGRLSGDEFTVLVTHVSSRRMVLVAAQGLLRRLADPFTVGDKEVYLSATIGAAVSTADIENGEMLLQRAELAVCEAKRLGGGMVRFYEYSMEPFSQRAVDLHRSLRQALHREELALHYQPLVDASNRKVVAAEALLRWQHDELGSVAPDDFIPVIEGTDLMLEVGAWVLRQACHQLKEWDDRGLPAVRMAVNIAPCQLRRMDLAALVEEILRESEVEPHRLELELSERGVLRDDPQIRQQLHQLRSLGVRLSVDDFGTGQSAIDYLKQFPLNVLKIDRSYVSGLGTNDRDTGLASAMVSMAHSLDLVVVAEGVEEKAQEELLVEWGCDELQGFLFSPAVREEEFRQMLASGFGGGETKRLDAIVGIEGNAQRGGAE